jgi:hypothetical protein
MVKSHKKAQANLIIDVDTQKLDFFDEKLKKKVSLNDKEKDFMSFLYKVREIIEEDLIFKKIYFYIHRKPV